MPISHPRGRAALFSAILIATSCLHVAMSSAAATDTAPLSQAAQAIQVTDARARPTLPNAASGVIYLTIVNHGAADDTLDSLTTPVADRAAMHRTMDMNGVMTMDPVSPLPVKAGATVRFAPGGLHVMLMGLKRRLTTGDSFPVTLDFEHAGKVTAIVAVGPVGPATRSDSR
jgi:copper(I)-binding protein